MWEAEANDLAGHVQFQFLNNALHPCEIRTRAIVEVARVESWMQAGRRVTCGAAGFQAYGLAFLLAWLAVFATGFASALRFAAQRWRILSAAASRWAAEKCRFFLAGPAEAAGIAPASGFLGGLPLRFVGP